MTGQLAALILLCTTSLIQPAEVPQQISLVVADVGANVTLQCPISEKDGKFFHWYKQTLGYMVQTVAARTYNKLTHSEQFDNPRFKVTESESQHILTIRNVTKEDEATYSCQVGSAYSYTFAKSIFLAVNDPNQQKSVYVKQSPKTESVQPGDSVTLQCSLRSKKKENRVQCPGEHDVYWFRPGSGESHPNIVYTHRNRSNEQEEANCAYSLSKVIQNLSDAGTYYCAVVTCGEILFGEGTKVETRSELDPVVIVLGVLLAFCVTVIAVHVFYVNPRRVCEHCKETMSTTLNPDKSALDQSTDLVNVLQIRQDGEAVTANYVALDFSTSRVKNGKRKIESPEECVYSAVAEYQTTAPTLFIDKEGPACELD